MVAADSTFTIHYQSYTAFSTALPVVAARHRELLQWTLQNGTSFLTWAFSGDLNAKLGAQDRRATGAEYNSKIKAAQTFIGLT